MTPEENESILKLHLEEKQRLSWFPYFQRDPAHVEDGVLLSDWIEHYCGEGFLLIHPFNKDKCLRPAGYNLRVGANYSIGGQRFTLNDGGSLTIKPYQVAVIQTLETLNMPDFLIGRWNIRVKFPYKGLLWVGGAQVDPGFRGRLSCPIYNLSTKPVTLSYDEGLAMIDFVTTTPFKDGKSKPFLWWENDKKLVFQQYPTDLQSGVEDQLQAQDKNLAGSKDETKGLLAAAAQGVSENINNIRNRIDTFVSLVFTVVAVLFTALGVVATKGSDESSFVSSTVWIAAVALYFALRPYAIAFERSREDARRVRAGSTHLDKQDSSAEEWYVALLPKPLEIFIAGIIVVAGLAFHIRGSSLSARQLRQTDQQAFQAVSALDQEKRKVETEIQLRLQSDARLESLQQQVNLLLQNQAKK